MVLFVAHRLHFMRGAYRFCLHGHLGKLNSLLAAGSTENLGVLGSRFLHVGWRPRFRYFFSGIVRRG